MKAMQQDVLKWRSRQYLVVEEQAQTILDAALGAADGANDLIGGGVTHPVDEAQHVEVAGRLFTGLEAVLARLLEPA